MTASNQQITPPIPAFRVTFDLLLAAADHEAASEEVSRLCDLLLDHSGVVSVEGWCDEKPQEFFDAEGFPELLAS